MGSKRAGLVPTCDRAFKAMMHMREERFGSFNSGSTESVAMSLPCIVQGAWIATPRLPKGERTGRWERLSTDEGVLMPGIF